MLRGVGVRARPRERSRRVLILTDASAGRGAARRRTACASRPRVGAARRAGDAIVVIVVVVGLNRLVEGCEQIGGQHGIDLGVRRQSIAGDRHGGVVSHALLGSAEEQLELGAQPGMWNRANRLRHDGTTAAAGRGARGPP